jgi:transposase InsO family protein
LTGARLYVLAVIEHASRRIRILGATPHPSASWVVQAAKNLIMDLEDAGSRARFLIRDRDGKFPGLFDAILADAGIKVVLSGIQMPRMNALMERWVQTCRRELLDRTLIWNQRHQLHALREFEQFYNAHRPSPATSGNRERPATARVALTDPGTGRRHPPSRPQTRPPRRHPPRVPARRLTCTDDIFGKHRIRILGTTPHPSASWAVQAAKNLIMDLEDAGSRARFLIRDRDGKFPGLFDAILADAGIKVVLSGIQMPRMNALMERWVQTCRRELLDRTLIWNQRHQLHALREFEQFYNAHRPSPATSGNRERPATARVALTDPGTGRRHPPSRPQTRPPRRHPPRVPARRLTCTDDIFGKHTLQDELTPALTAGLDPALNPDDLLRGRLVSRSDQGGDAGCHGTADLEVTLRDR